jgi:chaperonin GroES
MELTELLASDNLADELPPEDVSRIGMQAMEDYNSDDNDPRRQEKKEKWSKGLKLVQQVIEAKSTKNLSNAANIKYPLMTTACIQFAARAYPGLIQGHTVARPKIVGEENSEKFKKADRVCEFVNWQLFNEITEWEEDTDRLLHMLPFYGNMFRHVWGSGQKRRICTDIITPENFVVPFGTKNLRSASRISLPFTLPPREVRSKVESGEFRNTDYVFADEDAEAEEQFLEQHRWEDLDGDGIKEPYIVIIHESSGEVCSITANYRMEDIKGSDGKVSSIDPVQYFVKYSFIPSIDGNFLDVGFADLLYPINETVNSVVNQLVDAGTLANSNTGFLSSSLKLKKKGPMQLQIGEYQEVNASGADIRQGIVSMQFPGPSATLMSLLSFLLDAGRDVANLKEVLEGNVGTNMTATTTMALIEQGLKVFSGIYKRVHRALGEELQLIRRWNYVLANPLYEIVLDYPEDISHEDFEDSGLDFVPVSDPSVVTDMQKAAKLQWLMEWKGDPYHDQSALRERLYDLANIEGWDTLKAGQNPEVKKLQEEMQQMQQQYQKLGQAYQELRNTKQFDQQLKTAQEMREQKDSRVDRKAKAAKAILDIARAEGEEEGRQMEQYIQDLASVDADFIFDPQSGQIRANSASRSEESSVPA